MHGLCIQEQKHAECRKDVGCREVLCCSRALRVWCGVRGVLGVAEGTCGGSEECAEWCRECKQGAHGAQRRAGSVGGA